MKGNDDCLQHPSRMQLLREKCSHFFAAARAVFEKYVLNVISIVAAVIVLLTGFFIKYDYAVSGSTNSLPDSGITGEDIALGVISLAQVEQNMFNPVSAVLVPFSDSDLQEAYSELQDDIYNATQSYLIENYDLVLAISTMISSGTYDMAELNELLAELTEGAKGVYSQFNFMRLERLSAELALSSGEGTGLLDQSVAEVNEKLAVDSRVRASFLLAGSLIYIYIQVVALFFAVRGGIALAKGKKTTASFFLYYLPGMFALFTIGQLTAVGFNGAAIACFVLAALFGAVYAAGRLFMGVGRDQAVKSGAGLLASLLLFVSACLSCSQMYSFGTGRKNIGTALGLNCFIEYSSSSQSYVTGFAPGEAPIAIFINYLPLAVFHTALVVITLIALVKTLINVFNGRPLSVRLPAACAVLALVGYVAFFICATFGFTDLVAVGGQLFAMAVVSAIAALFCYIYMKNSDGRSLEGQEEQGEQPAAESSEN